LPFALKDAFKTLSGVSKGQEKAFCGPDNVLNIEFSVIAISLFMGFGDLNPL
jgi:hypothetical protein